MKRKVYEYKLECDRNKKKKDKKNGMKSDKSSKVEKKYREKGNGDSCL